MAETKVSARDYILLADIDNDGTFKPVACLTSNSLTSTVNTITKLTQDKESIRAQRSKT